MFLRIDTVFFLCIPLQAQLMGNGRHVPRLREQPRPQPTTDDESFCSLVTLFAARWRCMCPIRTEQPVFIQMRFIYRCERISNENAKPIRINQLRVFFCFLLINISQFIQLLKCVFLPFILQIYGADGSLLRAESRRGRGKGRGGGAVSILPQ